VWLRNHAPRSLSFLLAESRCEPSLGHFAIIILILHEGKMGFRGTRKEVTCKARALGPPYPGHPPSCLAKPSQYPSGWAIDEVSDLQEFTRGEKGKCEWRKSVRRVGSKEGTLVLPKRIVYP
jgi:hypothetical protein